MDWKRLALLAKDIPWKQVAEHGPQVASAAREFLRHTQEQAEATARAAAAASEVGAVRQQLEELQARQREHAVLTEQLAEQAQALAQGLELLSVRLKLAFAVAIAGLVMGIVALVLALV